MVDFELTSKQRQVKEFANQFARTVVRPMSLQADREHRVDGEFLLRLAMMRGAMSQGEVPQEYGGEGAGVGEAKDKRGKTQQNRFAMVGAEEMAWGDVS